MQLSIALLSRRSTFLSQPEWTTIPWEKHPKSKFDLLLDIMATLPALFERTDRILPLQATVMRRFEAQEVLYNCLALERQFANWVETIDRGFVEQAYWSEEMAPSTSYGVPFTTSYAFRDGITGLMYLHYWMALMLLHRCIDMLHRAIFEPVLDSYPNMWPDASPTLQIDPTRYQQTRELAGKVCRGLDSTLNSTVQPDMLLAPMTVALDLYRSIDAAMHNCGVEIMWLQGFRDRLVARGQHMASVLQSNKWAEVAKFA
jgi:(R)-2-hydroxyglutarate---pyruvate transhydrogenase